MKLIAGPMATLSHRPFRLCVERYLGADEYFTEMINAATLVNGGPFEKYYIDPEPCPDRLVYQLVGSSAETLATAAEKVLLFNPRAIGIDINMGCSAPFIRKAQAGSVWMTKSASELKDAVRTVRASLDRAEDKAGRPFRLSVKCRLGGKDFTEQSLLDFCDAVYEGGARLITLHPRTTAEKYRARARWNYAALISARYAGRSEVYLNGDVEDAQSAASAADAAPFCAGLMISRAIARRPWLFYAIRRGREGSFPPLRIDRALCASLFIDDVGRFLPPEFHKTRLQRFFTYYSSQFLFSHYLKTRLLNAAEKDEPLERCKEELYAYFEKQEEERFIEI